MRDLKLFATEAYPMHPSGLAALLICPWRITMRYLYEPEDDHGEAGDTGSATHIAVAEFHRGKEAAACIEAMSAKLQKYPKADLQDAAALFLKYASDPRNRTAKLILIEDSISFSIAPSETDETKAPIQVIGTVDQVRETSTGLQVWDLKTSRKDPMHVLNSTVFQMAAYCVGASIRLGKEVSPGGIITPRKYRTDPGTSPVFWHYPWKFRDIEQILSGIRQAVANIRAGRVWHIPNDGCCYCLAKTPDVCLPRLHELNKLKTGIEQR